MSINAFNDPASKGSFPPTLNSTKFHPKSNIPSTINGFYNPNLRKDDSLPGTLLPKGRTDATTASIPFKVRETTTKRTHSRFKSRQGYEDLLNSRSETTDNYHPERSSTFRSNYQRGIKLSSSNDSLRTLRYTTDGVESNILPPMRASFMLHKDYEPPVKTAEASTETVSGLLRANFPTLQDYNDWEHSKVEPFLAKLKSAIFYAKPEHLEEFVIGYCARQAMGQPEPGVPRSKSSNKKSTTGASILDKRGAPREGAKLDRLRGIIDNEEEECGDREEGTGLETKEGEGRDEAELQALGDIAEGIRKEDRDSRGVER